MSNEAAEKLVAAGKARWFNDALAAEAFAEREGAQFAGEVNRVSISRFLVVL